MSRLEFPALRMASASIVRTVIAAGGFLFLAYWLLQSESNGVVVLGVFVGLAALAAIAAALRDRVQDDPPLVVLDDAIVFKKQKLYLRDVTALSAGKAELDMHYLPLTLETSEGKHVVNLLGYAVEPTRVGTLVDEIERRWRAQRAS